MLKHEMKACTICKQELPIESFSKDKSRKDGLSPRCKKCKSQLDARYRSSHLQQIKERQKIYYDNNSQRIKERASSWYYNNTEAHSERMRQYFQDNKEQIKRKQSEWNEKNKEKMQKYINDYIKNKYQTDVNYKVKSILSARLRASIDKKSASTLDYLGCSISDFRDWIEYQFDESMSWENHGECWHFDHVKPCASYDLSNNEHVAECFNWKNIRPCLVKINLSKHDKVDEILIEEHKMTVEQFITRRTKEQ